MPVEVKSSNGTTISLNEALEKPQVPYGYKFVDGNVGVSWKKITLPHYMAMFLCNDQIWLFRGLRKRLMRIP